MLWRRMRTLCLVVTVGVLNLTTLEGSFPDVNKQERLPPCRACKIFADSFKKGIEKTSKGKFEGGDADWEEKKMGSYARSEIRLIEIQENVCSDVTHGKDQCYSYAENYDSQIEDWWFSKQDDEPDFYTYFCIGNVKHCCPELHFGPDCAPCDGYPDNICSGNGKCKGAGTRKGSGQCNCDSGYAGEKCEMCAESYFVSYRDDKKFLCSPCHAACDGGCAKAGPTGCTKCKEGWLVSEEKGCVDINECTASKNSCKQNQFCVNNEGSYKCLNCDRSCAGCTGDGPDECIRCGPGYSLVDNICTDDQQEGRKKYVSITRYMTYLGMCVATYIIFNKKMVLAAIIGIAVATYIAMSEYITSTSPTPNTNDIGKQLLRNE